VNGYLKWILLFLFLQLLEIIHVDMNFQIMLTQVLSKCTDLPHINLLLYISMQIILYMMIIKIRVLGLWFMMKDLT
jgi:hypothetical protein